MSTWTPGPWKINEIDPTFVVTTDGLGIADTGYSDDNDAEDRANAHLIAATPDLLAACEAALVFAQAAIELLGSHYLYLPAEHAHALEQIAAAIAKARGEVKP